ncbi:MAG: glycosyltransferase family 39 protein, partial [Chloroflexi bacterium]|nr:glycosyltransferase family 39 protein [Chloroflexota bacterium]
MNNRQTTPEIKKKSGHPARLAHRVLLLLSLLLAFGLRLFHLGGESLWYDETVSVALARQSIPALIAHTARDIHPPGYYLLLHGWQWLTHPSVAHGLEFLYAWPSLCFGLLIVALLYAVARRLAPPRVAMLTIWLAAINPFQLWYSQEVRMYTLGGALGLLCLWALLQYLGSASTSRAADGEQEHKAHKPVVGPTYRWLLIFALSGVAGLYTLYYFLFLLAALNLIALVSLVPLRQRQTRQRWQVLFGWLGTQLLILLLYIPWLPILWRQATDPPVPGWRTPWTNGQELVKAITESLAALLIGQSPPGDVLWPWALVTIAIVVLYIYTKDSMRCDSHWANHPGHTQPLGASEPVYPSAVSSLTLYIFSPILLIYLITFTVTPLYHVRYLFTYASPFMIIVA